MPSWEYRIEILDLSAADRGRGAFAGDAVSWLNDAGEEGWEAVAIIYSRQEMGSGGVPLEPYVLMKRRK